MITAGFRSALVAIANTPTGPHGLAIALDKSITTARKHLKDGLERGYLSVYDDVYNLTDKGKEAIINEPITSQQKNITAYSRSVPGRTSVMQYEVYVPPKYDHDIVRPGSMDAYKLPSLSNRVSVQDRRG